MTKKEIVDYLYYHHGGFSRKECKSLVENFFSTIKNGLKDDGKVLLSNFGTFYVKRYQGREILHPITGERVSVKTHNTVSFRKSKNG